MDWWNFFYFHSVSSCGNSPAEYSCVCYWWTTQTYFLLVLWLDKIFIAIFVDKVLENLFWLWLYFLVIECKGGSRDCLLDHVIFFMVIFYGYMLRGMDFTCMSTFSIRPFLFGLHSFEWLMLQSTIPHALLPSLLRGLLGLPLFLTSAFLLSF